MGTQTVDRTDTPIDDDGSYLPNARFSISGRNVLFAIKSTVRGALESHWIQGLLMATIVFLGLWVWQLHRELIVKTETKDYDFTYFKRNDWVELSAEVKAQRARIEAQNELIQAYGLREMLKEKSK